MAPTYQWVTLTEGIAALQARLNAGLFWSPAELQINITEALRLRNALCEEWKQDFVLAASGCQWMNLGTLSGSPRLRTVTDTSLYTQMQYMLLEPPTGGGTWNGTNQFSLQKLEYAFSNRRNEVIQAIACNLTNMPPQVTGIGTRRVLLPDTVLQPRRVRYRALVATPTGTAVSGGIVIIVSSQTGIIRGQVVTGPGIPYGSVVVNVVAGAVTINQATTAVLNSTQLKFYEPITLTREDTQAFQDYNPAYLQEQGIPQSWSVATEMPLQFDFDRSLLLPGETDVIALESGPAFAPPTPSLLGIPDDWSWLPLYGAMADLLGEEAESTDRQRANYCLKRYKDGLELMKQANWLTQATVNNVPVDTPPLADKDLFLPEWETSQGQIPCVVQAGMDFVAVAPGVPSGASLNLVQNAPVLDPTGVYLQVSRDDWASTLDYAHHLSAFKMGGNEFAETMPLMDNLLKNCAQDNARVLTYGLYTGQLFTEGQEQERVEPR